MTTVPPCEHSPIDRAKKSIAPRSELNDWLRLSSVASQSLHAHIDSTGSSSVTFDDDDGGFVFRDNVTRIPGCSFEHDVHGDTLPLVPAVMTGMLEEWPAFSNPGTTWSAEDLAARATTTTRVSLDGGPSFARMSMCQGKVTLDEYNQYCESGEADNDVAPLYIFDPAFLTSTFASDEFSTPDCFSNDAMACINGTQYRPLPPAWLLVGVKRSGTPIHDHPLTVAWNALLVGCKLWCCLPPDVDESLLLFDLPLDDEEESHTSSSTGSSDYADFDLSALEWFRKCGKLPESAKIIVQRPGEVVYLPAGWFHVVLNVETSTAISVSLTLRRDLPVVLPLLMEEDEDFATFWIDRLREQGAEGTLVDFCVQGDTPMKRTSEELKREVPLGTCSTTSIPVKCVHK